MLTSCESLACRGHRIWLMDGVSEERVVGIGRTHTVYPYSRVLGLEEDIAGMVFAEGMGEDNRDFVQIFIDESVRSVWCSIRVLEANWRGRVAACLIDWLFLDTTNGRCLSAEIVPYLQERLFRVGATTIET